MPPKLPAEITVTELPEGGVLYRLPRRPSSLRWLGLIPLGFGLFLASWPLLGILFFFVVGAMKGEGFWFALLAPLGCFGPICFPLGGFIMMIGLFTLAGHTEVRASDTRLSWAARCGWLRWGRSRPLEQITGFRIEHGGSAAGNQASPSGPFAELAHLKVECGNGSSFTVCTGYPHHWLLTLAEVLRVQCGREAPLTVSEVSLDPRVIVDRETKPAGSPVLLEERSGGLTLTIPALGLRGCHRFLLVWTLFWDGILVIMAPLFLWGAATGQVMWEDGPGKTSLGFMCLFLSPFILAGIGALLAVIHQARRSAVIDAEGDRLAVQWTGLFGTTSHEWQRDELAGVGVVTRYHSHSEGGNWETSLWVQPHEGEVVRMLGHRPKPELEWIATILRATLDLPSAVEVRSS